MFEILPELSAKELCTNILKMFDDYDLQTEYMYQHTKKGLYIQRTNRITCLSRTSISLSINLIDNIIIVHKYDVIVQRRHKYPKKLAFKSLELLEHNFETLIKHKL